MNGLQSRSFNIMVPLHGQRMAFGAITPQSTYSTTSFIVVVEIITNETANALSILAKQQTKICNTIYQNCLALDYLLASEGRVCGKFNLSNYSTD
jgi:hypothetical protein